MRRIGVLALQGDVSEHVAALESAIESLGEEINVCPFRYPDEAGRLDAIVLPGGESTTLGKLLGKHNVFDVIREKAIAGTPILATCAGMILMAKEGGAVVEKTGQPLLGVMDVRVERNAFGRQKESFETPLCIPVLGARKFPAVFIRAPAVSKVWGDANVLARYGRKAVLVRQGRMLSAAFHPELTEDIRLHEYFLGMI
ncbi:MAG: pyridoxal 5'-phosphate synthase glutaminase subunit PdxT [Candidatus Altiarchaeota archaeon]|nr:pyridoxal 5'-phosphate synthase glutaminase subunit PdxT [Candidatus Altiarchaeota archaeon]